MLGIIRAETITLSDITVFPLFILAIVLLVALVLYEKRIDQPILNIPLLARGDVLALNLAALAFGFCFFSIVMFIPSYAQMSLGLSIQDSGSILTPLTLSVLIMAIIGGRLMDKYGMKPIILAGSVVMCISLFVLALYVTGSLELAAVLLVMGIGVGFCMGSFQNLMMSLVPNSEKGSASGIVNVFMNAGGILGPTIASFYLSDASKKLEAMKSAMMSSGMPSTGMDMGAMMVKAVKDTMGAAYNDVFLLAAFVSVATVILLAYLLVRDYRMKASPIAAPEIKN
jgi:MFS family permease